MKRVNWEKKLNDSFDNLKKHLVIYMEFWDNKINEHGKKSFAVERLPSRWVNGPRKIPQPEKKKIIKKRRGSNKPSDLIASSMARKKTISTASKAQPEEQVHFFHEKTKIYMDDDHEILAKRIIKWYWNFCRIAGERLYSLDLMDDAIAHPNYLWYILSELEICESLAQIAAFKVSTPATNAHCERGLGRLGRWSTPERNRMSLESLTSLDIIHDDTLNQFVNNKLKTKNSQCVEICLAIMMALNLTTSCSKRYQECCDALHAVSPRLSLV